MLDRTAHLKIKLKSLAAEARIIRHAERRQKTHAHRDGISEEHKADHLHALADLQSHRRGVVRHAARESLLAYVFLRGKPYAAAEPRVRVYEELRDHHGRTRAVANRPNLKRVEACVGRFKPFGWHPELDLAWAKWREDAEAHLSAQVSAYSKSKRSEAEAQAVQTTA